MMAERLDFHGSTIRYYWSGKGEKALLCFHGFGENAQNFTAFAQDWEENFRVVAIDLPLHGETKWHDGNAFTAAMLLQLIDCIPGLQGRSFSLMGFSLGGRVALSLYELIPQRVEALLLLASDGLVVNPWYWFSTRTLIGNRLFRYSMRRPWGFFRLAKLARRAGLLNESVYKFFLQYLRTSQQRQLVYQIWTFFRELQPDLPAIKAQVRKYRTPVSLVYGSFDRIFHYRLGKKFRKGIETYCALLIVNTGHQVLQERTGRQLRAVLEKLQSA